MSPRDVLSFCLLSLVISALVVLLDSSSVSPSCRPDQRDHLLRLKNSFSISGPPPACLKTSYPKTLSWRENEDCCSWDGITCDVQSGVVIGLDLSCSLLLGTIDSNGSLFSLRHLRTLSLAGNHFLGSSIMPEVSIFVGMTHLNLSSSGFLGLVPAEVSRLSKLVTLDLSKNCIGSSCLELQSPTMRSLVRNLTALEEIDLTRVNMSMVIPTSLANFTSYLTSLKLVECWLHGELPDNIFQLPNLHTLDLSDNQFLRGILPQSNFSSGLVSLSLRGMSFTGAVPRSVGNLSRLTLLDLSRNMFKEIPDWFWGIGIDTLEYLNLESNLAEGDVKLPWRKLRYLNLHNNLFEGPLPVPSQSIQTFYASQNRFNGSIPPQICELPSLLRILLAQNYLTGIIPQCLGNVTGLEFVNLSNNLLTGPLPRSLASCTSLQILDVSYNNIIDTPPVWLAAASLRELHLQSNNFEGTWPKDFFLEKSLTTLDLSSNKFEGPPPCPSDTAVYYMISSNNFSGEINSCLCKADNLRILDMSNNGLTGNLPECLKNITISLVYFGLQKNRFHGAIPDIFSVESSSIANGSSLRALDFSRNQFEGPLPTSLLNCQKLEVLDVGNNVIADSFPDWLWNLLSLKVLSLRSNKFHGRVSISKEAPTFFALRILDLSENSLEGYLSDDLIVRMVGMMRVDDDLLNDTTYMGSGGDFYQQYYSVVINLKGVETEMLKINVELATLDLSSNHFHGELPRSIG